jgi:tetratricopeptide (TPR) repeat protein
MRDLTWVLLACACTVLSDHATAQVQPVSPRYGPEICGPLENGFGPFDYRTVKESDRKIVEQHHFTPPVESLQAGASGPIAGDLDYTLRAMPNHHRALAALTRLAQRERTERLRGTRWPVECYFERAIRFAPDDGRTHAAFGAYLHATGRKEEGLRAIEYGSALQPDDPLIAYNFGLLLIDAGFPDRALEQAKKAYGGGIQLPGLRRKIEASGRKL